MNGFDKLTTSWNGLTPNSFWYDQHRLLFNKDCRSMADLPDESIDLIVTDPPYGIGFMGKEWDKFNEVVEPQGAYQHKKGFKKLPRQNTASMSEFFVPVWKECLRVLKDGAFAFVMCSPRADVMAKQINALEDAGFKVGFTPIFWAYASGFPKAQNIGKAVDKRLGIEPIDTGIHSPISRPNVKEDLYKSGKVGKDFNITRPNSDQAKALDGSYGGFQPKPAIEVIIVAMKPLSEKTYVDQALKNGKGITWLDDGRIPYKCEGDKTKSDRPQSVGKMYKTNTYGDGRCNMMHSNKGRFPANLICSDDVLNDGKKTQSGKDAIRRQEGMFVEHHLGGIGDPQVSYPDSGSFSRYFDLDKWFEERIKLLPASVQKTFPFLIVPKASKSEKNRGLDYEPQPIVGRDEGQDIRNVPQKARSTPRINQHPTVKPLKLFSYLITLGSREGDVVLDPFLGSGTTMLACELLGRKSIGYEISEEYCKLIIERNKQAVLV